MFVLPAQSVVKIGSMEWILTRKELLTEIVRVSFVSWCTLP